MMMMMMMMLSPTTSTDNELKTLSEVLAEY